MVVGIGALVIIIGIYVIKIKNVSSPDGGAFMSSLSLTTEIGVRHTNIAGNMV